MADDIRFYADQHYPAPVSAGLRRRGIDITTAQLAIHQSGLSHTGIVWCPATKYGIGDLIRMLVLLHAVVPADDMIDHVEYL